MPKYQPFSVQDVPPFNIPKITWYDHDKKSSLCNTHIRNMFVNLLKYSKVVRMVQPLRVIWVWAKPVGVRFAMFRLHTYMHRQTHIEADRQKHVLYCLPYITVFLKMCKHMNWSYAPPPSLNAPSQLIMNSDNLRHASAANCRHLCFMPQTIQKRCAWTWT